MIGDYSSHWTMMIIMLLALLGFLGVQTSEAFNRFNFASTATARRAESLSTKISKIFPFKRQSMELGSSTLTESSAATEAIKKWFFMNYKKRSEVFELKDATSYPELVAEIWRSVLISIRVLEKDEEMKEYVSVHSFPAINASQENVASIKTLVESMSNQIDQYSPLFQDAFARSIKTLTGPSNELIVSIETTRRKSRLVDYEVEY